MSKFWVIALDVYKKYQINFVFDYDSRAIYCNGGILSHWLFC